MSVGGTGKAMRDLVVLLGIPIDNLDMDQTLERIEEFIHAGRATGKGHQVATINVDFIVKASRDQELRYLLQNVDLATADGMPLLWASRLLRTPLKSRVTGIDLVSLLAGWAAKKRFSIYLLGAGPGIATQAAEIMKQMNPDLIIAGVSSPPFLPVLEMDPSIQNEIRKAHPDILLVAFGNPKQEKWIGMVGQGLNAPVMIGVGGSLDFITGNTKRAPVWVQSIGLEWLSRLVQEPRRLWQRYLTDFQVFGIGFIRQWWAMVPRSPSRLPAAIVELDLKGRVATLKVRGEFTQARVREFQEIAKEALTRPEIRTDLAETTFLDSSALGALVDLARQAQAVCGNFSLVRVPPKIWKVLSLFKLEAFLNAAPAKATTADIPEVEPRSAEALLTKTLEINGATWKVVKAPRIIDAASASILRDACSRVLVQKLSLTIDFSETVYLLSAGIAALGQLQQLALKMNAELRLTGGSAEIQDILRQVHQNRALGLVPDHATGDDLSGYPHAKQQLASDPLSHW